MNFRRGDVCVRNVDTVHVSSIFAVNRIRSLSLRETAKDYFD
jgi:hypothetical protein